MRGQSQREATKWLSQFSTLVLITHIVIWRPIYGSDPTTSLPTKIANLAPSRTCMASTPWTTAQIQWMTTVTAHTAPESLAPKVETTLVSLALIGEFK